MAKQATPYRMTALSDIKPYERNPRIISQAAVDAVARSIQAYGFRQPIVVDRNGVILAGHTRYRAAQQLGMTEVPVVWQTDITDVQARGYRIADNKVAELSAWDRHALDTEVRELAGICSDDLDALGLADWELDRILSATGDPGPIEEAPPSYAQPYALAPAGGAPGELFADTVETESSAELGLIGGAESSNRPELKDKTLTICYSDRELALLAGVLGIPEKALPGRRVYTVPELLRDRGAQNGGASNG